MQIADVNGKRRFDAKIRARRVSVFWTEDRWVIATRHSGFRNTRDSDVFYENRKDSEFPPEVGWKIPNYFYLEMLLPLPIVRRNKCLEEETQENNKSVLDFFLDMGLEGEIGPVTRSFLPTCRICGSSFGAHDFQSWETCTSTQKHILGSSFSVNKPTAICQSCFPSQELTSALITFIGTKNPQSRLEDVKTLVKWNADVNFEFRYVQRKLRVTLGDHKHANNVNVLSYAISLHGKNSELAKFLRESGAKEGSIKSMRIRWAHHWSW